MDSDAEIFSEGEEEQEQYVDNEIEEDEESDSNTEKKKKKKKRAKKPSKEYPITNFLNYSFEDIQQYFDHPINHAAKSLSVSETYLKKLCRYFNIFRWPYRKLSSLQKKIDHIKGRMNDEELPEEILRQVLQIREEMQSIRLNPSLVLRTKDNAKKSLSPKDTTSTELTVKPASPTSEAELSMDEQSPVPRTRSFSMPERYAPYPQMNMRAIQEIQETIRRNSLQNSPRVIENTLVQSSHQYHVEQLQPQQLIISPPIIRGLVHNLNTSLQNNSPVFTGFQARRDSTSMNQVGHQDSPLGLKLDAEEVATILQEVQFAVLIRQNVK